MEGLREAGVFVKPIVIASFSRTCFAVVREKYRERRECYS